MIIVFDLDDTLYNEIDFVKSGFKEIASYLNTPEAFDFMLHHFETQGSGKVFDALISHFKLKVPLKKLIEIYRFHTPTITLNTETLELLQYSKQFSTALISDGHYIMQKNKFHTLGLETYIDYPIFTDFYHTKKPEQIPFKMLMKHFSNHSEFIYISDNPKKDFIAPTALNWTTIRYKNPYGIYKEILNNATYEVHSPKEILLLLKKLSV